MSDALISNKLLVQTSLKDYFFQLLKQYNQKSIRPLPEQLIFYSSELLERYVDSDVFYDLENGRLRHRVLGTTLLEVESKSAEDKMKTYKLVGEMSLMLCGYFSESIDRKILSRSYYKQLGVTAFSNLNNVLPKFWDIPDFYLKVAHSFDLISGLLLRLSLDNSSKRGDLKYLQYIDDMTEDELQVNQIYSLQTNKIS